VATVRVIRRNLQVSQDDLAPALMRAADLDADEAFGLVRCVAEAPAAIDVPRELAHRIAAALESCGHEVAVDP